jgi:hypothetical protein
MTYAVRSKSGQVLRRFATQQEAEKYVRQAAHSPTRATMTRAEAKRRGELAGAAHADGWIDRNRPGREELESAIVSQSNRAGWADTARSLSYDKGIYGGGARVEANRKAFVEGYVEAILKELKREYGRQGSPIALKLREVQRVFEAHLASGKGRAVAASLTVRHFENPRIPHRDIVQAVERVAHLKKYQGRSPMWSQTEDTMPSFRHPRDEDTVPGLSRPRNPRDELHAMTTLLVRRGVKDPAARAWAYQKSGLSLPELEFRLDAGERMSPSRWRWVCTPNGTAGKVLEVQSHRGKGKRYLLELSTGQRVWVHGRVRDIEPPHDRSPTRRRSRANECEDTG